MSSELERRLEGLLAEAPEPDPGAGEKALHRALRALQPAGPSRRGLRTAVLAFAAAAVLLVIAAGSLAAAGALHVSFGAKAKPRPATTQLVLPRGANGIAAIVDGRLSVVTKGDFRLQGRPVRRPRSRRTRSTSPPASATRSPRWRRTAAGPGPIAPAARSSRSRGRRTASGSPTSSTRGTASSCTSSTATGRRHDDRPLGAGGAALLAGHSLAFAYVGGGGRRSSTTWATRPACRRRAPAGHRPCVRAVGRRPRAGGAERRVARGAIRLPAHHRSRGRGVRVARRPAGRRGARPEHGRDPPVRSRRSIHGLVPGRDRPDHCPEARRRTAGAESRRGTQTLLTVPRGADVRDVQVG